jgi:hypothetical protein
MTDKKKHYVDNEKFFIEIKKWKQRVIDAREVDDPDPPSTEYMGECFLKISENLAWRPNFINYTFRDDMVSDGIENCLLYAHNFNPEKSKNPFSYFTQIIHHAYIRRITKEKKQMYIKYRVIENEGIIEQLKTSKEETNNKIPLKHYKDYLISHEKYADNPQPKKPKKKSKLEHFMK